MPAPTLDATMVVETLKRHEVEFVVVGGFAVELWDVAIPPTVDIDITPETSPANLQSLADALNELDAVIRSAGERIRIPGGFTGENIENMRVLNLMTSAGPVDITVVPAGTNGFRDLIQQAHMIEYEGIAVPTAHLADVARSKEAAGRPKDIKMLPAIRAHLERLGEP